MLMDMYMAAHPQEYFADAHIALVPLPDDPEATMPQGFAAPDRQTREEHALRDDLTAIVAKVGTSIDIPQRPFTVDEWLVIRMLRSVLRSARVNRTWTSITFSMLPVQVWAIVIEHGESAFTLGGQQAHSFEVELFGSTLQLGWYRFMAQQARIANMREVREHLATNDASVPIRLYFVPGQDNRMEIRYPEWGPTPGVSERARYLDAAERIVLLAPHESSRLNELLDLGSRRSLSDRERHELNMLVEKHRQLSVERQTGLYAERNQLESAEARKIVEDKLSAANASWAAFQDDPARMEAAIAIARQRRVRTGG